jgi:hypothetical protein
MADDQRDDERDACAALRGQLVEMSLIEKERPPAMPFATAVAPTCAPARARRGLRAP